MKNDNMDRERKHVEEEMKRLGICVVVPSYNNGRALGTVLEAVLSRTSSVVVVNDGSTDDTGEVLARYASRVEIVTYPKNRGKGYALARGFDRAESLGFRSAITMDSDGQHAAEDIPRFVAAAAKYPGAMITGSRCLKQKHMPRKNTFANRFSNFWFAVQTGRRLPDTQTGFRLYPLDAMKGARAWTSRYEAELEMLVRAAWRGIPLVSIPVRVYYPPAGERVTHFRPGTDFLRISLLNTCLVFGAIFYGYPSRFIHAISRCK
jgi:glycosyltransferase involved in cell wall biosynthesis